MKSSEAKSQATVSVHALEGGKFTLPERFFVTPLEDQDARRYVPSLCFLIQHHPNPQETSGSNTSQNGNSHQAKATRILFDLGLRRDISLYSPPIQAHTKTRLPIDTSVDVIASLNAGGLASDDIDMVILSHVHWDHIGLPADFGRAKFVVGNGSLGLLSGKGKRYGSHSCFEEGILPSVEDGRTVELEATPGEKELQVEGSSGKKWSSDLKEKMNGDSEMNNGLEAKPQPSLLNSEPIHLTPWTPLSLFPHTIDLFHDNSIHIISSPGHLSGHLNLLCRTSTNPLKHIYLAGDACHDRRLLTGEKGIAEWAENGNLCCIHADRVAAKETLSRIWEAECGRAEGLGEVEVVFAHDAVWEEGARREGRFWPGRL